LKAFAIAALLGMAGGTVTDTTQELHFVTCPIYRDTDAGAKSGCWLADDPATGIRYDVSRAPSKPDWNAAVLVEGRVAPDTADPCGGKILDPVRTSVLDQPCTRFMLAAETYPGRKFALPKRNVRPLYEVRKRPEPPYKTQKVVIPFNFGKSFIVYQLSDYYIDEAINAALDVQPARVMVTGFADSQSPATSDHLPVEPIALAQERADLVGRALVMRGVPRAMITVATGTPSDSDDEAFDGLRAPSRRRVEVAITPLPAPAAR
jgi:outer membrane protein OmpA-like peptidoglycan-associated protein